MQIQSVMAEGNWRVKFDKGREFQRLLQNTYKDVERPVWEGCQDAENLIYSFLPWGYSIVEKLGIPGLPVSLYPVYPTRFFPTQLMPLRLGRPLNLLSHYFAEQILELFLRKPISRLRENILHIPPMRFPLTTLGLLRQRNTPLLCNLSPTVISPPPDWPASVQMHGFWFLPEPPNWQPPADLVDFIHQVPQPVFIGFGSMVHQDLIKSGKIILQALERSSQRAVVAKGCGEFTFNARLAKEIFPVDDIPFSWLFPQMKGVVHHGGAGTTAFGLRAGVPELVIPHMQEQPYWAQRLHHMGVSPKPIPVTRLTAEKLGQALVDISQDQKIIDKARHIGEQIRNEQGLSSTIRFIESYFH